MKRKKITIIGVLITVVSMVVLMLPLNSLFASCVPGCADISITKVADKTIANPGDTITYTITVTNTGSLGLYVAVQDPVHWSGDKLLGLMNPGDSITIDPKPTYTVQEADIGTTITNTASVWTLKVSGGSGPTDSATAEVTVPEPGLEDGQITVVKSANGFTDGEFKFRLELFVDMETWTDQGVEIAIPFSGGSNNFGGLGAGKYRVIETETNGAGGTTNSLSGPPSALVGDAQTISDDIWLSIEGPSKTVYFDNIKEEPGPDSGNITVVKRDPGGTLLAGAGFTVYFAESGNPAAPEGFTADSGMITFAGLPFGSYIVRETTAPAGFGLAPDQAVVLASESVAVTVNYVDSPVTTTVTTTATGGGGTIEVLGITEELPFTGQSMWLYIIGAAMLALAGGLTFVLRAAKSKE